MYQEKYSVQTSPIKRSLGGPKTLHAGPIRKEQSPVAKLTVHHMKAIKLKTASGISVQYALLKGYTQQISFSKLSLHCYDRMSKVLLKCLHFVYSLPVEWFVEELQTNPELARIIVHKFVDADQDGELTAEELLRPIY